MPGRRAERELRRHVDHRVGGRRARGSHGRAGARSRARNQASTRAGIRRGDDRVVRGAPVCDPALRCGPHRGRARAPAATPRAQPARPRRSGPELASRGAPSTKPATLPSSSATAPEAPSVSPTAPPPRPFCSLGVLVRGVEQGLEEPLRRVALGEQRTRAGEVLGGEREDRRCGEGRGRAHVGQARARARHSHRPQGGSRVVRTDDPRRLVSRVSPKTLTGEELQLDDGRRRRRSSSSSTGTTSPTGRTSRYPRSSRRPGASRPMRSSASRTCCSSSSPTTSRAGFASPGTRDRPTAPRSQRRTRRGGGRCPTSSASSSRTSGRSSRRSATPTSVQGWEADDVIATIATRADEAAVHLSSRPIATRSSSAPRTSA